MDCTEHLPSHKLNCEKQEKHIIDLFQEAGAGATEGDAAE